MTGNSLVLQWLGHHALTVEGPGSISGQGTKIPQAEWCGKTSLPTKTNKQTKNTKPTKYNDQRINQEDRTIINIYMHPTQEQYTRQMLTDTKNLNTLLNQ